jgi:hypothetical protein
MWQGGVVLSCALLAGCANTASHTPNLFPIPDATAKNEVLAVLPFAGHLLRREAGEWLAHKLQVYTRYRIISPGFVEARLGNEITSGRWATDQDEARRLGTLLGAQMVGLGYVISVDTAEVEVTLIDVSSGTSLRCASSPSKVAVVISGHYPIMVAAVEEVAQLLIAEMQATDARRTERPRLGTSDTGAPPHYGYRGTSNGAARNLSERCAVKQ